MEETIRPLKYYCQKILPAVYDDSLSYYELVCKTANKVNEIVSGFNSLDDAFDAMGEDFKTLYGFVHGFFNEPEFKIAVDSAIGSRIADGTISVPSAMLAFGDSFGKNELEEWDKWPELLAKHYGLTPYNYCQPGYYWGARFEEELDSAIAEFDTADKKSSISFAIVYGGVNNVNTNPTGLFDVSLIQSFIIKFNAAFPGVPLYIATPNASTASSALNKGQINGSYRNYMNVVTKSRAFTGNFIFLKNAPFYLCGADGNTMLGEDGFHPSKFGQIMIANAIASAMSGGSNRYFMYQIGALEDGDVLLNPGWIDDTGYTTPEFTTINHSSGYKTYAFVTLGFPVDTKTHYLYGFTIDPANSTQNYIDRVGYAKFIGTSGLQIGISRAITIPEGGSLYIPQQHLSFNTDYSL